MDGILIIDKPAGITSHDVVSRVRRNLKTKRIGHTGTLDPFATGVMVILVGKATRLAQFLDKDEKEYEAVVRFGFETDTGDATGVRTAECGMRNEQISAVLGGTDWKQVLSEFRGEIEQTPPMYSAKKIDGKKLYEHARRGIEVERDARKVNIHELRLSEPPAVAGGLSTAADTVRLTVRCSAGTYIRTLAEDIGRKLKIGAHLSELRRTHAGRFDLMQSITLDDLEKLDEPSERLLPLTEAVPHLPTIILTAERAEATKNGLSTRADDTQFTAGQTISMLDADGELLAVGIFDAAEKSIRPKVVLV